MGQPPTTENLKKTPVENTSWEETETAFAGYGSDDTGLLLTRIFEENALVPLQTMRKLQKSTPRPG